MMLAAGLVVGVDVPASSAPSKRPPAPQEKVVTHTDAPLGQVKPVGARNSAMGADLGFGAPVLAGMIAVHGAAVASPDLCPARGLVGAAVSIWSSAVVRDAGHVVAPARRSDAAALDIQAP
jgi:hypothetical protein